MFKRYFKEYILKNKYDLTVLLIMLITGIMVGIGIYIFSDASIKEEVIHKATEVFKLASSKEYIETNVVANGIKTNIILLAILLISSVTLFGRYVIEMLMLLKGAMLSTYSMVLFNVFGVGYGILVVLLLVVLVNLIYIPAYLFLSLLFMEIHFNIFKTKQSSLNTLEVFGNTIKILIGFVFMFSSVILEQMASLVALKVFLKLN